MRWSQCAFIGVLYLVSELACSTVVAAGPLFDECGKANAYLQIEQTYEVCSQAIDQEKLANADLARTYSKRADAFYFAFRLPQSLADANRALDADPKLTSALNRRAWIYLMSGQRDTALRDITESLAIDPTNANTYIVLGYSYPDDREGALKSLVAYKQALALDPSNALAQYNIGVTQYWRLGNALEGLASLDKLLARDPQEVARTPYFRKRGPVNSYDFYGEVRFWRGEMLASIRRRDEALADYTWLIEHAPKVSQAYISRSRIYGALRQHIKALADADMAKKLDPYNDAAKLVRLYALNDLLRYDEMEKQADELIEGPANEVNRGWAYRLRAVVKERKGEVDAAVEDYLAAFARDSRIFGDMSQKMQNRGYLDSGDIAIDAQAVRNGLRACVIDPEC